MREPTRNDRIRRGNAGGLYVKESTTSKGYERRCGCHFTKTKTRRHPDL